MPASVLLKRIKRWQRLLFKVIGKFKVSTAKIINQLRNTSGANLWHRNYYEHIVRNDFDLWRIREYIKNNPANWQNDRNNSQ